MIHFIRTILIIALCLVLYKLGMAILKNGWHYEYGKHRTSQIYSLKTTSEINGSFILGIGSIGGEDYYVFYRKTNNGGLIREKIRTSDCVLYEGYPNPRIMETGKNGYYLVSGDTMETSFSRDDYSGSYHSIYIPKGTITERVDNIDIK